MIDISKPIYAKIYDYDEAYCESDCDDTCGSYIIREVEELHFATKRCEAFIRYSDGFVSKTFKLLPQIKLPMHLHSWHQPTYLISGFFIIYFSLVDVQVVPLA